MSCVCELFPTPFLGFIQHDHCRITDYGSTEKAQEYNEQNFQIHGFVTSSFVFRRRIVEYDVGKLKNYEVALLIIHTDWNYLSDYRVRWAVWRHV